MQEMAFKFGQH